MGLRPEPHRPRPPRCEGPVCPQTWQCLHIYYNLGACLTLLSYLFRHTQGESNRVAGRNVAGFVLLMDGGTWQRRVASRMNQIVRALQGSMDSLTHDAYLERRVSWRGVQQEWCLIECLTLHQGSQAREATAGRSMIGAAHSFTYTTGHLYTVQAQAHTTQILLHRKNNSVPLGKGYEP